MSGMSEEAPRSRLGRGLAALIGDVGEESSVMERARPQRRAPVAHLKPSKANPRRSFHEEELADLTASVREKGVIQPIIVRRLAEDGETFEIIAGERRWRAAQRAEVHDVPIVGISKGPDRNAGREHFHLPDGRESMLPPGSPVLFYLQRLRDEAHRFAIGAHRAKRAKSFTANPLDDVPGIGPARKKALLMHFGTARSVRGASLDDLKKAPGVSAAYAQQVYDF